ncbi:hypothetical protein HYW42_05160 [Candidatus Daviesbacteria bacterium]|nr:hypothetical protein [Candidatus Daviesbacteria bacterium]
MTDDDVNKLSTLMDSKLDKFKGEIKKEISTSRQDLSEEISAVRQDLSEEISAVRQDLSEEISAVRQDLSEEISASEKRVIKGIVDFVSDHLIPLIDEKADKTDVERIERKLDSYIDETIVLKARVGDIEALPTVAHELKVKKNK